MNTTIINSSDDQAEQLANATRALAILGGTGVPGHVQTGSSLSIHESTLRQLGVDPRNERPSELTTRLLEYGVILLSLLPWLRYARLAVARGLSARAIATALRGSLTPSALRDEEVVQYLIDASSDETGLQAEALRKSKEQEEKAKQKTLKLLVDCGCWIPTSPVPFALGPEDGPMLTLPGMPGGTPKFGKQLGKSIGIAVASKLAGVAAGAAIGSVVPGIGTAIGALVGLGLGLLGNKQKDPKDTLVYKMYGKTEGYPNVNVVTAFLNKVLKETTPQSYAAKAGPGTAKAAATNAALQQKVQKTIGAIKRMQFITGLNLNPLMFYVKAHAARLLDPAVLVEFGRALQTHYAFPIAKGDVYALVDNKPVLMAATAKKKDALMDIAEAEFPGDTYLEDGGPEALVYHHQGVSYRQAPVQAGLAVHTERPSHEALTLDGYLYTLAQSKPLEYEEVTGIYRDTASVPCACPRTEFWTRDDQIKPGRVYQGSAFSVDVGDLPNGVYGEVDLSSRPFRMVINRRVMKPRALISFAHESMHIMDALYKLNLTHEQVHALGVYLAQEVMPAYNALDQRA